MTLLMPDTPGTHVENGRMGRVAYARIAPNEDLIRRTPKPRHVTVVCLGPEIAGYFGSVHS